MQSFPQCSVLYWTPAGEESGASQQGDITPLCHCRTTGWRFWSVTSSAGSGVSLMRCFILDLLDSLFLWADRMTSPSCFILFFCMRELYLTDASLAWWTADWTFGQTWQPRCHKVTGPRCRQMRTLYTYTEHTVLHMQQISVCVQKTLTLSSENTFKIMIRMMRCNTLMPWWTKLA